MIKVSIIVPVYNVQQYLVQCMDSILAQTLREIEVICVDDGSTDQSGAILDEYAAIDDRIQVIHKVNAGYGHTMNLGMSLAKGEYIGIVESDDFIDATMYETLYRKAKQEGLDVIKARYMRIYQSQEKQPIMYVKEITSQVSNYGKVLDMKSMDVNFESVFATWSGIYKRAFIEANEIKHNETPGASYQDVGFSILTTLLSERLMYVEDCFYRYRVDNEASSVKSTGKVYCVYDEYEYILKCLERYPQILERYKVNLRYKYMTHFKRDVKRIEEDSVAEFVHFTKSYIERCRRNDEYSEEWCGQRDRVVYNQIESNPDEVIECIRQQRKNRAQLETRAVTISLQYKDIVIYGAGNYGRELYHQLQALEVGYMISRFAVTIAEHSEICCERPVVTLDEIENKGCLLIVAVVPYNYEVIEEMTRYAQQCGFEHITTFAELLGYDEVAYIR